MRLKAETLSYGGQPERGVLILEELLAADPQAPANAIVLWVLALAHFAAEDLPAALDRIDAALLRVATMPDLHLTHAAVLAELNRTDEAQSILHKLQGRNPELGAGRFRVPPYKQRRDRERYLNALHRGGLPLRTDRG